MALNWDDFTPVAEPDSAEVDWNEFSPITETPPPVISAAAPEFPDGESVLIQEKPEFGISREVAGIAGDDIQKMPPDAMARARENIAREAAMAGVGLQQGFHALGEQGWTGVQAANEPLFTIGPVSLTASGLRPTSVANEAADFAREIALGARESSEALQPLAEEIGGSPMSQTIGQTIPSLAPAMAVGPLGRVAAIAASGLQQGASTLSQAQSVYDEDPETTEGGTVIPNGAFRRALLPALADTVTTAAITAVSGKLFGQGVEGLTVPARRALITNRVGEVASGFIGEALEEASQQFVSDYVIGKLSYKPDTTLEQAVSDAIKAGIAGGVLGGAVTTIKFATPPRERGDAEIAAREVERIFNESVKKEVPPVIPAAPGGSPASLTPERRAESDRNNSLKAFAEANGVTFEEGDTAATLLAKVNAKKVSPAPGAAPSQTRPVSGGTPGQVDPPPAVEIPPPKPRDNSKLYALEYGDLLETQRNLEEAEQYADEESAKALRIQRDDIIQRLDQFDGLFKQTGDVTWEDSPDIAAAKALRRNPKMTLSDALAEGSRLRRQYVEDLISDGEEVPEAAKQEYPDLFQKQGKSAPVPPVKEPWQMTKAEWVEATKRKYAEDNAKLKGQGFQGVTPNEAAHYNSVKNALAKGKPVPAEVLAEYPDLNPAAPPTPAPKPAAPKVKTPKATKVSDDDLPDVSAHLAMAVPDVAAARQRLKLLEELRKPLQEEHEKLKREREALDKVVLSTRGPRWNRGKVKASAKAKDVAKWREVGKKIAEIEVRARTLMESGRPDQAVIDSAIDAEIITDESQPLLRRVDRRIRMLEGQQQKVPKELIRAREILQARMLREQYPDITAEEIAKLSNELQREIYFNPKPNLAVGMLDLYQDRRARLEAALNRGDVPRNSFSEDLKNRLARFVEDKPSSRSAALLKELLGEIESETRRVHEESAATAKREAEEKAAREAQEEKLMAEAQAIADSAKRKGTVGGRSAKDIKVELVARVKAAITALADEDSVALEQREDGLFVARGKSDGIALGEITPAVGGKSVKFSVWRPGEEKVTSTAADEGEARAIIRGFAAEGKGKVIIGIPGDGVFRLVKNGPSLVRVWVDAKGLDTTSNKKAPTSSGGAAQKPPTNIRTKADWVEAKEFHGLRPDDKISGYSPALAEIAKKISPKAPGSVTTKRVDAWIAEKEKKPAETPPAATDPGSEPEDGDTEWLIEEGWISDEDVLESRIPGKVIRGRSPAIQAAIQDVLAGQMTREQFHLVVQREQPIAPVESVPTPATHAEMRDKDTGVKSNSIEHVGKGKTIPKGKIVSLRIDLPWKVKTGKSAVVVHEGAKVGRVLAFEGVGRISNPNFSVNQKEAAKIGAGEGRTAFAAVSGEWNPDISIPADIMNWTQVGYDPTRHSYFYDKKTLEPITGGSEVVQIGGTLFVKDAVSGSSEDVLYSTIETTPLNPQTGSPVFNPFTAADGDLADFLEEQFGEGVGAGSPLEARGGTFVFPTYEEFKAWMDDRYSELDHEGMALAFAEAPTANKIRYIKDHLKADAHKKAWITNLATGAALPTDRPPVPRTTPRPIPGQRRGQPAPPQPPRPPARPTPDAPPRVPSRYRKFDITALVQMMRQFGKFPTINERLKRAYGRYISQTQMVELKQRLFWDTALAERVLGHEIGHFIDLAISAMGRGKQFAERLIPLWDLRHQVWTKTELKNEARSLSRAWRGPFANGDPYRDSAAELFADFMSAMFNNPEMVNQEYPKLFDAFEQLRDGKPSFKNAYREIETWLQGGTMARELQDQDAVEVTRTLEALLKPPEKNQASFRDRLMFSTLSLWNRAFQIEGKPRRLGTSVADELEYNQIWAATQNALWADDYGKQVVPELAKVDQDPIKARTHLQSYSKAVRTIGERRAAGVWIERNPDDARELLRHLLELDVSLRSKYSRALDNAGDPELYDLSAAIFREIHDRGEGFVSRMAREIDSLDLGVKGESALMAFNVRGKLLNPGGLTVATAQQVLNDLRSQLTPEQFQALENAARSLRGLLFQVQQSMHNEGLISDATWTELILPNINNYVPYAVLDYFEGRVGAGVMPQKGTAKDVADIVAATQLKVGAANVWRQKQRQVQLLRTAYARGGIVVPVGSKLKKASDIEAIKASHRGDDISRAVIWKNGRPHAVEFPADPGKQLEKAMDTPAFYEHIEWIHDASDLTHRAMQLYTQFSVPFLVWRNPIRGARTAALKTGFSRIAKQLSPAQLKENTRLARNYADAAFGGTMLPEIRNLVERQILLPPRLSQALVRDANTMHDLIANHTILANQVRHFDPKSVPSWWKGGELGRGAVELSQRAFTGYEAFEKIYNYQAAIAAGMSPEKAGAVARRSGIPKPGVGGKWSLAMEVFFPWTRVHMQGMRATYDMLRDPEIAKGFAIRLALSEGAPRVAKVAIGVGLVSGALKWMLRDDEDEDDGVMAEFMRRVSPYKMALDDTVPLYFYDARTGKVHYIWDFKRGKDVPKHYEAVSLRIPASEEGRLFGTLLYNTMISAPGANEKLGKPGETLATSLGNWTLNYMLPGVSPVIETSKNLTDMIATGRNPTDSFRNQPAAHPLLFEAGGVDRAQAIAGYTMNQLGGPGELAGVMAANFGLLDDRALNSMSRRLPVDYKAWNERIPFLKTAISHDNYAQYREEKIPQLAQEQAQAKAKLMMTDQARTLYEFYYRNQDRQEKLTGAEKQQYAHAKRFVTRVWGTLTVEGQPNPDSFYSKAVHAAGKDGSREARATVKRDLDAATAALYAGFQNARNEGQTEE